VKKPPKPSRFAEDEEDRHQEALRRQETLARLEQALREQLVPPQEDASGDGDPYNSAGRKPVPWEGSRKR
jgi:hypothetical protein